HHAPRPFRTRPRPHPQSRTHHRRPRRRRFHRTQTPQRSHSIPHPRPLLLGLTSCLSLKCNLTLTPSPVTFPPLPLGGPMSRTRYLFLLLAVALFSPISQGQVVGLTDQTATPSPGAGHDYIHMLNETVIPASGSVSIRIEVPTPPGRKMSLP